MQWLPFLREGGGVAGGVPIQVSPGATPANILTDNITVAKWARCGLAGDVTSVEHAAIVTASARWPLMLDPQLQVCRAGEGRLSLAD